jgi:hypothetical protein
MKRENTIDAEARRLRAEIIEINRKIQAAGREISRKGSPQPGSGPSRSVQVGPGERAVRSGDPTSPATTTGHGPQRFPAVSRAVEQEAKVLVAATAGRIGRRYQRDQGQIAEELWRRTNDLVGRVPLSLETALAQVARELESDILGGRA